VQLLTALIVAQVEKYKKADFGKCPRVMCDHHPLLPMGQSDLANVKTVKLYCSKCEDIYNPKSSRHASIDGAYFGTSFHNILFQVYPTLISVKSTRRYEPRVFGFKVHACAALARWQDSRREETKERLRAANIDAGYIEDSEGGEEEFEEDGDELKSPSKDGKTAGDAALGRMDLEV
jgi:casein kinase II subunit beta